MLDDLLPLISRDPRLYRSRLIVRGPRGPEPFANIEQDFQRPILASIDEAFRAVREDRQPPTTRIWVEATKGAGKDTVAAMMLLWLIAFTQRGLTAQVLAADRSQADELRRAAIGMRRENEWLHNLVEIQNWLLLNPHSGSRAEIIASDEAGGHGSRPDVVIINELTHQSDRGPAETAMDNAAKVPANVTIILTNHGVRDTWQWEWRQMAKESLRWAFHSFQKPAPWINRDELSERRRSTSDARYRRLWEGEWIGEDESALSDAAIAAAITLPGPRQCREDQGEQVFAGVDLSISRDRSSAVILTRSQGEKIKLASCRSWTPPKGGQIDLSEIERYLLDAHARFNFHSVYFDVYQAEHLAQRLRRAGVPMTGIPPTVGVLQEMASGLLESFNSGEIALFDHRELITDLRQLRFIERGNSFRLDAPKTQSGHADTATAFALACLACRRNPTMRLWPFVDRKICRTLDELIAGVPDAEGSGPYPTAGAAAFAREVQRVRDKQICDQQPVDHLQAILRDVGLSDPDNWGPDFQ